MFAPSKSTLRNLAGAAAVALTFNAVNANAAGLIDDDQAVNTYRPKFSMTLAKAAGDDAARIRARGFMVQLEDTLKAPADKTRVVDYPKPVTESMLRITAVVAPKGLESQPIPVCAEQNNKVLGTWNITNDGHVVPVTGNWSTTSAGNSAACKEFILGQRSAINQLAQERANGAPSAAAKPSPPAN